MAFFDRMKDSLTTAGQEVSQKAKNATENVRLSGLIKNNDKMIEKLLYQVGLKYYEAHGLEEGTEYQDLFSEIRRLKDENAGYQQELSNLASTNKCPQCGFGNNAGAKFCISCGAPLNQTPAGNSQAGAPKYCGKCGAVNEAEAIFCTECGSKLDEQSAQTAEQQGKSNDEKKKMVYGVPVVNSTGFATASPQPVEEAASAMSTEPVEKTVSAVQTESAEEVELKEKVGAAEEGETVEEIEPAGESEPTAAEPARCEKCGAPLEEDALFCTSCGAKIEK